jgi:putative transposase
VPFTKTKAKKVTPICERQALVGYIQQAVTERTRIEAACDETDINLRTYRRWAKGGNIVVDKRPDAIRVTPANKLSKEERDAIVKVVNQPEFPAYSHRRSFLG